MFFTKLTLYWHLITKTLYLHYHWSAVIDQLLLFLADNQEAEKLLILCLTLYYHAFINFINCQLNCIQEHLYNMVVNSIVSHYKDGPPSPPTHHLEDHSLVTFYAWKLKFSMLLTQTKPLTVCQSSPWVMPWGGVRGPKGGAFVYFEHISCFYLFYFIYSLVAITKDVDHNMKIVEWHLHENLWTSHGSD